MTETVAAMSWSTSPCHSRKDFVPGLSSISLSKSDSELFKMSSSEASSSSELLKPTFPSEFKVILNKKHQTESSSSVGVFLSNSQDSGDKKQDPPENGLDWSIMEGQLYDRQEQKHLLLEAFHRRLCCKAKNELILVSGEAGTGKTALALTLREICKSQNGFFVMGKFDQLQRPEPYAPFVAAFTDFTHQVIARGIVPEMKQRIRQEIDSEFRLLIDMLPALEQILGSQGDTSQSVKGSEAQQQLKLVFLKFIKAICSPQHPLILCIDDLQWADSGSLDLLLTLLKDADSSAGFMILGTCRYNEVALEHPLAVMLRTLEDEAHVPITNILVGNLNAEAVNKVVSTVLRLDTETSKPLADIVHNETNGNIFFVMQFLKSLHEEGILFRRNGVDWQWDSQRIHVSSQDVVLLVSKQMERLEPQVQEMLMVASCIGAEFDEYLLHDVLNPSQVAETLATALTKGLILVDRHAAGYRFTHDKVQQAAYSLIPEEDRDTFHLTIGRQLWKNLSAEEIDMNIFLVVNQLSRGIHLVEDQDELYGITMLCLRAGEKATLSSDFATAAEYLGFGIELLGSRGWRDQYDLSLNLYNAAAEAEYCTAKFDRMDRLTDQVLLHARSFHDKLRAYTTQVYSLGARQQLQEAIDMGFGVSANYSADLCDIYMFTHTRRVCIPGFGATWRTVSIHTAEVFFTNRYDENQTITKWQDRYCLVAPTIYE